MVEQISNNLPRPLKQSYNEHCKDLLAYNPKPNKDFSPWE